MKSARVSVVALSCLAASALFAESIRKAEGWPRTSSKGWTMLDGTIATESVGLAAHAQAPNEQTRPLPKLVEAALLAGRGAEMVDLILGSSIKAWELGERQSDIEALILRYVKPIPASDAAANAKGYMALSKLVPGNASYAEKAEAYQKAEVERASAAVTKLKKSTDEFNGVTFYEHPSKPRYTDTRTYFLPYLGEKDRRVYMRFRVNYTADAWLFVEDLFLNIDGDIVRFPPQDWSRDNDSEIWEWIDVAVTPEIRSLIERIAKSEKTIARFEGMQYNNNVTISSTDKQAMRDMLLAEEVLSESLKGH